MGTKVIALSLKQVSRQAFRTIAVIVGQSAGEAWNRNSVLNGSRNHFTPCILIAFNHILEVRIKEKVLECRITIISILNVLQELRTNDAAAAEDHSDVAIFQIPAVLIGSCAHLSEALSIGYDFTCKKCFTYIFNKLFFVARKFFFRRTA
ncbi:hypothetical protein D3C73_1094320 [compost metagenome]